jgi:hypothetical protein
MQNLKKRLKKKTYKLTNIEKDINSKVKKYELILSKGNMYDYSQSPAKPKRDSSESLAHVNSGYKESTYLDTYQTTRSTNKKESTKTVNMRNISFSIRDSEHYDKFDKCMYILLLKFSN